MTISTSSSQITFLGNGATSAFTIPFVIDSADDIEVIYYDASNVATTIPASQYTLVINPPTAGQIWGVGGTLTYLLSGSPIANDTFLVVSRLLPYTQTISIANQGDFAPEVIEEMGDTLEMQIQQLAARTTQFRGTWVTNESYTVGDIVQDGDSGLNTKNYYICLDGNTSGTWATDLAAGDWGLSVSATVPAGGTVLTFTGDATGTGTTNIALTIPANTVTNAKSAQMASHTFKANASASTSNATDVSVSTTINLLGLSSLPTAINGFLITSLTGSASSASATITAGVATDSSNAAIISGGPYNWAANNGNVINGYSGGTALPVSTTIHLYACSGTTGTGSYAIPNASYPLAAASAPSGYNTSVRRVGSFNTSAAGAPLPYTQVEGAGGAVYSWLTTQLLDVNVSNLGTSSRTLYTLSIPIGFKCQPLFRANTASAYTNVIILTSGDETDVLPTGDNENGFSTVPGHDFGCTVNFAAPVATPVLSSNTSGQIGARASAASTTMYLVTRGFLDWRRS